MGPSDPIKIPELVLEQIRGMDESLENLVWELNQRRTANVPDEAMEKEVERMKKERAGILAVYDRG